MSTTLTEVRSIIIDHWRLRHHSYLSLKKILEKVTQSDICLSNNANAICINHHLIISNADYLKLGWPKLQGYLTQDGDTELLDQRTSTWARWWTSHLWLLRTCSKIHTLT